MELMWYGLGCFRIVERGYPAVVTEPFDEGVSGLRLPRSRVDIVTSSSLMDEPENAQWKGLRNVARTLAGPGEYEIGGLFVTGVATQKNLKRGAEAEPNVAYAINVNGIVVCHLGELGKPPTQSQVEIFGRVNVLLLPVGIPDGMTPAMASEVISLIEPDVVIPMNYQVPGLRLNRNPVNRFLKELGIGQREAVPSLKISAESNLGETQVVLLELQQQNN